jgi:hypothetical protein
VGVLDTGGALAAVAGRSRWVARRHRVPAFSADPAGHVEALHQVLVAHHYDVLLPTHEALVAVSRCRQRLASSGTRLAVADFEAVRRLQDKCSAVRMLDELGLPQPRTVVVSGEEALRAALARGPAYLKLAIGTGSQGVWRVESAADRARVSGLPSVRAGLRCGDEFVVQAVQPGELVMVQALFAQGRPVAWHLVSRSRAGVGGGAAAKVSLSLPAVREHLVALGGALGWHGQLSLDAILDGEELYYIDVNPRLVEPVNAELAGVGLVDRWVGLALGRQVGPPPPGRAGVKTHILLMALLRQAETGGGRRAILAELAASMLRRGWYADSREELLPVADPLASVPLLAATAGCLLMRPQWWQRLSSSGSTPPHVLTPTAWELLLRP